MSRKAFNGSGMHTFPSLKDQSGVVWRMQREGRVKRQRFAGGCDEWGSWGEVTGIVTQAKLEAAGLERCEQVPEVLGEESTVMDWMWEEMERDVKETPGSRISTWGCTIAESGAGMGEPM